MYAIANVYRFYLILKIIVFIYLIQQSYLKKRKIIVRDHELVLVDDILIYTKIRRYRAITLLHRVYYMIAL